MRYSPKFVVPALFGLALMPSAAAIADEQHHQPESAAEAPPAQTMPMNMMGSSSSGMSMMNMMGQGGMGMMGQQPAGMPMMNMMGQGGMGMMGGMPMADMGAHIEGRIAFLRAELGITEAQTPQWDAFAQALRDSTAKLKAAQAAPAPSGSQPATFLQRTELQAQWLAARLDGLKAVQAAFAPLQAVLSEDQKKIAEALLTRPVCFGQMGMM